MTPFSSVVPGTTSSMPPFAPGKPVTVLDANAYDALELVAEAFGGIGRGTYWADYDCPVCAYGAAAFATDTPWANHIEDPIADALQAVGITVGVSDIAVAKVQARLGLDKSARITFAEWAKALNVVRGPHPTAFRS